MHSCLSAREMEQDQVSSDTRGRGASLSRGYVKHGETQQNRSVKETYTSQHSLTHTHTPALRLILFLLCLCLQRQVSCTRSTHTLPLTSQALVFWVMLRTLPDSSAVRSPSSSTTYPSSPRWPPSAKPAGTCSASCTAPAPRPQVRDL